MDKLLKIVGLVVLVLVAIWLFGKVFGLLFKILIIAALALVVLWLVRGLLKN